MDPKDYKGEEWLQFIKGMTPQNLRRTMKRAYYAEAKKAIAIARRYLRGSSLKVKGNTSDWEKGIRSHIYSKGGGFMLTVKARSIKSNGTGEKSMHKNRHGLKKPVLMWAEDGTRQRFSNPTKWHYETSGNWKLWARHGGQYKPKRRRIYEAGVSRGRMKSYGFLDSAGPEIFRQVESDLKKDIADAAMKVAQKYGLVQN